MLLRSAGVTVVAALALHAAQTARCDDAADDPGAGRTGHRGAGAADLGAFMLWPCITATSANVAFILAFNTFFSALFAAIFLKERPHLYTIAAMAAMVFAVLLIVEDGISAGHWLGDPAGALATAPFFARRRHHRARGLRARTWVSRRWSRPSCGGACRGLRRRRFGLRGRAAPGGWCSTARW
ncbi:MAG: hypothetical protein IPL47_14230 [Phyllobacteriaceae bacterium]|nr:hypothetical protein [Phyllobacteriaceae bacterium]